MEPPGSFFPILILSSPRSLSFPPPSTLSLKTNKQTNKKLCYGKFQNVQKYMNPLGAMSQLQQSCFTYIPPGELSKCADAQAPPKMRETESQGLQSSQAVWEPLLQTWPRLWDAPLPPTQCGSHSLLGLRPLPPQP